MLRLAVFLLALVSGSVVAQTFQDGSDAVERGDFTSAYGIWKHLANEGDSYAQFNLGVLYYVGQGVAKNDVRAVFWYHKAAQQGIKIAQYNLGWMYDNGIGIRKNEDEAVYWYLKAAQQGYAEAQYQLGRIYEIRGGTIKNNQVSLSWYQQAAEQGLENARDALERLRTAKVEQDSEIDQQQSQLGKIPLPPAVGDDLTVQIKNTPKSPPQQNQLTAFRQLSESVGGSMELEKVTDDTDPAILYSRGRKYMIGKGVSVDYVEAYMWFTLAMQQGSQNAAESLAVIQSLMDESKILEAQKLAREFYESP